MATKRWYQTGKEGFKRSQQEDEAAKARREQRGPRRFWLKSGSSAKVTFLDTPQFFLYEHGIKIGKSYRNYFTCIKDLETCPLCEANYVPSYIMAGTVIDHSSYTDENGKTYKNQKRLFVAKGAARQIMLRKIKKKGGDIKFYRFEFTRGTNATECSTGEDIEVLGKVSKEKLLALKPSDVDPKEWLAPFSYEEIFAPKSAKELARLVGLDAPVGQDDEDDEENDFEDTENESEDEEEADDEEEDIDIDEEEEEEESEEDEEEPEEDDEEDDEEDEEEIKPKNKKKDKGKEKTKAKEKQKEKARKKEAEKTGKKKHRSVDDLM